MKTFFVFLFFGLAYAEFKIELTKIASMRTRLLQAGLWQTYLQHKRATRLEKLASNLATVHQGVNDYSDVEYVGNITIGTPGQFFNVILDTGSANLLIPDVTCTNCVGQHKFNSSQSSTYRADSRKWNGGGNNGFLGIDTVTFVGSGANLSVPNTTFTQLTSSILQQEVDGILGLAFASLSIDNVTPVLVNAINQGLLDNPWFTVYLKLNGAVNGVPGGVFTYGNFDTDNCGPLIAWQPLSSATFFQFRLTGLTLGSYTNTKGWEVISDTATSFIGGPQSITDALAKIVGATYDTASDLYYIDCSAKPPPLNFQIGNHTYALNEKQLIVDAGNGQCYWAVFPSDFGGFGPAWIIGDPFIRQYCHTYDLGGKRIGFSLANGV